MESHEDICVVEPNFQVLKSGHNQSFISHQCSVKYKSQGDRALHGCISMLFVICANIIWWREVIKQDCSFSLWRFVESSSKHDQAENLYSDMIHYGPYCIDGMNIFFEYIVGKRVLCFIRPLGTLSLNLATLLEIVTDWKLNMKGLFYNSSEHSN